MPVQGDMNCTPFTLSRVCTLETRQLQAMKPFLHHKASSCLSPYKQTNYKKAALSNASLASQVTSIQTWYYLWQIMHQLLMERLLRCFEAHFISRTAHNLKSTQVNTYQIPISTQSNSNLHNIWSIGFASQNATMRASGFLSSLTLISRSRSILPPS